MCVLCAFVGVFCAGGCLLAILFGCGWWCLCERLCAHVVLDVAGRVCLCVCVGVGGYFRALACHHAADVAGSALG